MLRNSRIVPTQSEQRFRQLINLPKIQKDPDPSSFGLVEKVEVESQDRDGGRIVESWRCEGGDGLVGRSGVEVKMGEIWEGGERLEESEARRRLEESDSNGGERGQERTRTSN